MQQEKQPIITPIYYLTRVKPVYESINIKPYTLLDIAKLYGIGTKTMAKWLKPFKDEIGHKHGRYFTVLQVQTIINKLGLPHTIVQE